MDYSIIDLTTKTVKYEHHPLVEILSKYDPKKYDRLNWDDYFISQALLTSFRSPSEKLQVGAIIVRDNRIITTGYNGYFPNAPHQSISVDDHEVNTVHAEQNALAEAAKRGVSVNGSIMYITHYPCINCAKMIIACGITQVKYLNDYKKDPITQELFGQMEILVSKHGSHFFDK